MKILTLLLLSFLITVSAKSQYLLVRDAGGLRLNTTDGTVIPHDAKLQEEGIFSLPNTNCGVSIITKDNKLYRNFQGRLDLRLQKIIFTVDDQDLVCSLPLDQIIFDSCETRLSKAPFKNGFPAIDKQNEQTFYQVLTAGKTVLLKFYGLKWTDNTPYTGNLTIRKYEESISYYLLINNVMTKLSKKNGNLLSLIQVPDSYIKSNKLSLTKEDDVTNIVRYYNSL